MQLIFPSVLPLPDWLPMSRIFSCLPSLNTINMKWTGVMSWGSGPRVRRCYLDSQQDSWTDRRPPMKWGWMQSPNWAGREWDQKFGEGGTERKPFWVGGHRAQMQGSLAEPTSSCSVWSCPDREAPTLVPLLPLCRGLTLQSFSCCLPDFYYLSPLLSLDLNSHIKFLILIIL